jgi:hypothetical protein
MDGYAVYQDLESGAQLAEVIVLHRSLLLLRLTVESGDLKNPLW